MHQPSHVQQTLNHGIFGFLSGSALCSLAPEHCGGECHANFHWISIHLLDVGVDQER